MTPAAELRIAHTADLDAGTRHAARALLDDVFDDMTDADWHHALGGMHATVWEGPELIGHASVIQRQLLYGGRARRTGYVEAVAVREDRRRGGHGGTLMDAVERIIRGAYEVGALGSTDAGAAFYAARGWLRWLGPCSALTPEGIIRTPDEEGSIYVLPVSLRLDVSSELTCDWREGDAW
jgi:aminoglycoside 2'-N-acetyltransferase I